MGRRIVILLFVCATLALCVFFPQAWQQLAPDNSQELPPGVDIPKRQLLRVWLIGDMMEASGWLRKEATRFEKEQKGVSVYLRTAQMEEIMAKDAVLPDMIVFSPGMISDPERIFAPIQADLPLEEGALRAGRYRLTQLAVPLCLTGYALCYDGTLSSGTPLPPVSTPLIGNGISSKPLETLVPDDETTFQDLMAWLEATPVKGKAEQQVVDFQCAEGMPLYVLSQLSGGREMLNKRTLSKTLGTVTKETALADFLAGRCRAMVATTVQMRRISTQGKTYGVLAPVSPVSDMYLSAGIVAGENQGLALSFFQALLSLEGQAGLSGSGMLSVRESYALYSGDPLLTGVEQRYQQDVILPNAFSYDPITLNSLAKSAWNNSGDISDAIEPLR